MSGTRTPLVNKRIPYTLHNRGSSNYIEQRTKYRSFHGMGGFFCILVKTAHFKIKFSSRGMGHCIYGYFRINGGFSEGDMKINVTMKQASYEYVAYLIKPDIRRNNLISFVLKQKCCMVKTYFNKIVFITEH